MSLVISHPKRLQINDRENRRLAPADALVVQYEARGAVPTNASQTIEGLAGAAIDRCRRQGAEGHLSDRGSRGGGSGPPGERAMLREAGAAEAHSALQRDYVCFGSGLDPEGACLAV